MALQTALRSFQDGLDSDQKQRLLAYSRAPDAAAVIALTVEIDENNARQRSRCVASRIFSFLESVQQFSAVVDTFVSTNPRTAGLIWGSVKLTLLTASNAFGYFDKLSAFLMDLRHCFPRYSEYQLLYASSIRLQNALSNFYGVVVSFCGRAIAVQGSGMLPQITRALWKPFESEFRQFQSELAKRHEDIKEELFLVERKAADKERQLQEAERKASRHHRGIDSLLHRRVAVEQNEACLWRRQAAERDLIKNRRKLLDRLSCHDYKRPLKQACRKRYGNTCTWILDKPAFSEWLDSERSSLFWCSGIPGSGKTVLTANIICNLFSRTEYASNVAFFFCQYDDAESLKATTILGTLLRQRLESVKKETDKDLLDKLGNQLPDADDLAGLLTAVCEKSGEHIFIIDGIDECEKQEREVTLSALRGLMECKARIFISSRYDVAPELERSLKIDHHLSLSAAEIHLDINAYIDAVVDEKVSSGELVVGQPGLILQIKDALINEAEGMFLWVSLQIYDICEQKNDADIRLVLNDLPKGLSATYERALNKIRAGRTTKIAERIFRWVAAAKRCLTLEELREAIAVEPGQRSRNPETVINDINQLVPCCRNLIQLDEELQTVHFAHHTVKGFLLAESKDQSLANFHFQLPQANLEVGGICVTYLNFEELRMQLTRQVRRTAVDVLANSPGLLKASLENSLYGARFSTRLMHFSPGKKAKLGKETERMLRQFIESGGPRYRQTNSLETYSLLSYAGEHWLSHTQDLSVENAEIWNLWTKLLLQEENQFAQTPWDRVLLLFRDYMVIQWIIDKCHFALLRYIRQLWDDDDDDDDDDRRVMQRFLDHCIRGGHQKFLRHLLQLGHFRIAELNAGLQSAAFAGHVELAAELLAAHAEVNAVNEYGETALSCASKGSNHQMIEFLLKAGADIDIPNCSGRTALHIAVLAQDVKTVELLLYHGADVNIKTNEGETMLYEAVCWRLVKTVELLLHHGADVNAVNRKGESILHCAIAVGDTSLVRILLSAGADVSMKTEAGETVLHAAVFRHLVEIVELLVHHGADVNTVYQNRRGVLHYSIAINDISLVRILLSAGADANMKTDNGETVLYEAVCRRLVGIVELLLHHGADVNTINQKGESILHYAIAIDDIGLVRILLRAGADINIANKDGKTAYDSAYSKRQDKIMDLLRDAGARS